MNKNKNNNWYKRSLAQGIHLNDLIDYVDDDTINNATEALNPRVVDFDALETQRAQNMPLEQEETIGEDNLEEYLADNFVEQDEQVMDGEFVKQDEEITDDRVEEGYFDGSYIPSKDELEDAGIEEIVDTGEEAANEEDEAKQPDLFPDFKGDHRAALDYAQKNNRVVKLSYLTLGKKKGRGGRGYNPGTEFLKRERDNDRIPGTGVNIWRIVEPHDIFTANNEKEILVTYDRSVRHIRAFRLENVQNVELTKMRGTESPSFFKPGGRNIKVKNKIKGVGEENLPTEDTKGTIAMNANIFQNLKSIGDDLEGKGLEKTAALITATMSNLLNIKTAQYVGPQGYWIRQRRCFDNCYRQNRTSSPEKAAQVVWQDCWGEYNKSISNINESDWAKYAEEDIDLFKFADGRQVEWVRNENKKFAKTVETKIAAGESQGQAIYNTLEDKQDEYSRTLLADADKISVLATQLKEMGRDKLSEKVANASVELVKEAQFDGGWSGESIANKMRKYNPFSGKSRAKGRSGDIITRLKNMAQRASELGERFNSYQRSGAQHVKDEVQQEQDVQNWNAQVAAKQQKRKEMPGKAFNWGKQQGQKLIDKGQQAVQNLTNPAGKPLAPGSLSESTVEVKTADYAKEVGTEFINSLISDFYTFRIELNNESAALAQLAAQAKDGISQQRASQAASRLNKFVEETSNFMQESKKPAGMLDLGRSLRPLTKDINAMQSGQYDPNAVETAVPPITDPSYAAPEGNPDGDDNLNKNDNDRNNDGIIDNPEDATVPAQTTDLMALKDLSKENIKPVLKSLIDGGQITVEQINELEKAFRSFRTSKPQNYKFQKAKNKIK